MPYGISLATKIFIQQAFLHLMVTIINIVKTIDETVIADHTFHMDPIYSNRQPGTDWNTSSRQLPIQLNNWKLPIDYEHNGGQDNTTYCLQTLLQFCVPCR